MSDNAGTITWAYDGLGRQETVTDVHGLELTYAYDNDSRVDTITDSEGGVQTLGWDARNRLESLSFDDGTSELKIAYTFNLLDQVTEARRYSDAAGTTLVSKTGYAYDLAGNVEDIHHKFANNTTLNQIQYTYDNANRVKTEDSTLGDPRDYDYDPTGQVLGDGSESFSFDLNGNRTMSGYSFDVGNRIQSDGTWDYTHDDEGNIIEKEHISSGELWIYSWDHSNRLTKAEHKANSSSAVDESVAYAYDALGNKIQRSYDADGAGSGTATVEKYAHDAYGNPWADLDGSGSLTTRRLFLDAIDAVFARIGSSGNEDWLLTDNIGSIRDIVNSSGTAINHVDWTSFGKLDNETGTGRDRFGFAGFEHDEVTGLGLNGARWYSFDIGMWWSEDPLGYAAGDANLQRYIGNSSPNGTDPSGLDPESDQMYEAYRRSMAGGADRILSRHEWNDLVLRDILRARAERAAASRSTSSSSTIPPPRFFSPPAPLTLEEAIGIRRGGPTLLEGPSTLMPSGTGTATGTDPRYDRQEDFTDLYLFMPRVMLPGFGAIERAVQGDWRGAILCAVSEYAFYRLAMAGARRTTQLAPRGQYIPPPNRVDNGHLRIIVDHLYQGARRSPGERMLGARNLAELVRLERAIGRVKHTQEALNRINQLNNLRDLSANDQAIVDTVVADLLHAVNTTLR